MTTPIEHPRVHGYDRTIVIVRGNALPPELAPARLPREPDRQTVIVAADPPIELPTLTELLARHLPVRCESIRLVLSDAGQPGVAQAIADELGIEVLAPTGAVMLLRTGMLFVADGTWWCFRPGQPEQREGARHPAPEWQRPLPPAFRAVPAGLRVTAIPAGLWVHDDDRPELTAAVLSVFVDNEQLTVVVGRPGTPVLPPESVYDLLESLPRQLRRRLVLVPYGSDSATADTVGEWLAVRTGGTVEVMSGVADTDSDGAMVRTTVDASGVRGWRPFVQRLVYRAGAAPQVVEWRRPLPDVAGSGGVQRVDDHWAVEVVRCGLWLRLAGDDPEQDLARRLPVDANHPLLVLGAPAVAAPTEALAALERVVGALSEEVAATLRLAVTSAPETDAPVWAALVERFGPLLAVVGPGHLVELPTAPFAPAPAAAPAPVPAEAPTAPVPELVEPPTAPVLVPVEPPTAPVLELVEPPTVPVLELVEPPTAPVPVPVEAPTVPVPEPAVPPTPRSAPLTVLVGDPEPSGPAERRSGPGERQALRDLFGRRYQRYVEAVGRSAWGRAGAGGGDTDAARDDLAAVVAFVDDDELFRGDAPAVPELMSCLASGVSRLPVAPGAVFATWAVESDVVWGPGDVLGASGVLAAQVSPYRWDTRSPVFGVWSTSGRRTAGVTPAGREHVLFPAGARFRVVGLEQRDGDGPALVLVRELAAAEPATGSDAEASDRRAREGLRRAVEAVRRSEAGADWPVSSGRG